MEFRDEGQVNRCLHLNAKARFEASHLLVSFWCFDVRVLLSDFWSILPVEIMIGNVKFDSSILMGR